MKCESRNIVCIQSEGSARTRTRHAEGSREEKEEEGKKTEFWNDGKNSYTWITRYLYCSSQRFAVYNFSF